MNKQKGGELGIIGNPVKVYLEIKELKDLT